MAPSNKSILIVEDEPLIAMMLEDFLESLGHAVVGTFDAPGFLQPCGDDPSFLVGEIERKPAVRLTGSHLAIEKHCLRP